MGIPVLLYGKSGSGKSTSARNFGEKELYLVNVSSKPLPFRKNFESVFKSDNYENIKKALEKTPKNSILIDDAGYLITNQFMRNHSAAGAGNGVFAMYNELGDNFWQLIEYIKKLPENKIVYLTMHEDKSDSGDSKPKTIGRLLDEKVCLEGMFTIVLKSMSDGERFYFKTQSNGLDTAKSPIEMFEKEIDNDLKMVDTTIREYWGLEK